MFRDALSLADQTPAYAPVPAELFGVYVHWPFCRSKCPYCDFNSHVRAGVDHRRWRDALVRELTHFAALVPQRPVTSVFFGGGTPSLMEPQTVADVLEAVGALWGTDGDLEVTLEANPTSVEARRLAAFAEAGVNRVSIGVQALDDAALRFLGREHSAAEALEALQVAHTLFERVSFDLIYARPQQTESDWRRELGEALDLIADPARAHLSLYQLTIEPGTQFHTLHQRGALRTPNEDRAAALFDLTQELTDRAGLPAYEISNHAAPGQACRHNLTYWRGYPYVGVGPGAHGRIDRADAPGTRSATRQHRAPEAWLDAVERDGHATRERTDLSPRERLEETVLMGLRLRAGLAWARLQENGGDGDLGGLDRDRLQTLGEEGLVEFDQDGVRATAAGRRRLNAVLAYLLA